MRKTLTLAAALLAALTVQAADFTIDELVAKNTEAKGGLEKLRAVQSIRMSGKMALGPMEAPFVLTKKRPGQMRIEFTLQGMTATQAYDGTTGWAVMPFLGKKDAEPMSADELKLIREQADFDGPFLDTAKKGHKLELLGKDTLEGTPVFKVRLVTNEGNESTIYLDAESFLEIRTEGRRKIQGQEMETATTIGNYQEIDGLLFPFSLESKAKGAHGGQVITIEKIEINPPLDDASFRMPEKKAAAEAVKE